MKYHVEINAMFIKHREMESKRECCGIKLGTVIMDLCLDTYRGRYKIIMENDKIEICSVFS